MKKVFLLLAEIFISLPFIVMFAVAFDLLFPGAHSGNFAFFDYEIVVFTLATFSLIAFIQFLLKLFCHFLYLIGVKIASHTLIAQLSPYDVWLVDHCPYDDVSDCRCWTCPAYDKYHCKWCKLDDRASL